MLLLRAGWFGVDGSAAGLDCVAETFGGSVLDAFMFGSSMGGLGNAEELVGMVWTP